MFVFIVWIMLMIVTYLIYCAVVAKLKYENQYKAEGIFGRPGSGKSITLTARAEKMIKAGWIVYADYDMQIDGVRRFDSMAFKRGDWVTDGNKGAPIWFSLNDPNKHSKEINEEDHNICLIFDEMGITFPNRSFKTNFNDKTLAYAKYHRHYRTKVIYASQQYEDMDKRWRDMAWKLSIISRSLFRLWIKERPILIRIDIDNGTGEGNMRGGKIIELYQYDFFLFNHYYYMPKWVKKFDSFSRPKIT